MKKFLLVILILSLALSMSSFTFATKDYDFSSNQKESYDFSPCFAIIDVLTGEVFYVSEDQWLLFMSIVHMNDEKSASGREQMTETQINILTNNLLDEWRVDETVTITRNFERVYYVEDEPPVGIQNIMPFQTPHDLLIGNFVMTFNQSRTFSNPRRPTNNFYPVNGNISMVGGFFGGVPASLIPPTVEFRLILGGETNRHTIVASGTSIRRTFTNLNPSHGFRVGILNLTTQGSTTIQVENFTVTSLL